MPKITKISAQKSGRSNVNIFIDDKYAFSVPIDVLAKHKLSKNQEISDAVISIVFCDSVIYKLFNKSLNYLSYRPRTEHEVKTRIKKYFLDYLYKNSDSSYLNYIKDKEALVIDSILDKLNRLKLLDDYSFAEKYVEQALNSKKVIGTNLLRKKLIKLGLSREVIDYSLEKYAVSTSEIKELAEKKLAKLQKYSEFEKKNKLANYLINKGFSYDDVKNVVDSMLNVK